MLHFGASQPRTHHNTHESHLKWNWIRFHTWSFGSLCTTHALLHTWPTTKSRYLVSWAIHSKYVVYECPIHTFLASKFPVKACVLRIRGSNNVQRDALLCTSSVYVSSQTYCLNHVVNHVPCRGFIFCCSPHGADARHWLSVPETKKTQGLSFKKTKTHTRWTGAFCWAARESERTPSVHNKGIRCIFWIPGDIFKIYSL